MRLETLIPLCNYPDEQPRSSPSPSPWNTDNTQQLQKVISFNIPPSLSHTTTTSLFPSNPIQVPKVDPKDRSIAVDGVNYDPHPHTHESLAPLQKTGRRRSFGTGSEETGRQRDANCNCHYFAPLLQKERFGRELTFQNCFKRGGLRCFWGVRWPFVGLKLFCKFEVSIILGGKRTWWPSK